MAKLGAKFPTNVISDGFYGFTMWKTLLDAKREARMLEYGLERYKTLPNPNVYTLAFRILGMQLIDTREPENIKAILSTQFNDFSLGRRHDVMYPLLGDGIFTQDNLAWKHSRALLRPQFAREQVGHVKLLEPHLQVFFKHVRKAQGQVFDIQELFFRLTVDTSTEFLFGESVQSLRDESVGMSQQATDVDGKADFPKAFNISQEYLASRAILQSFFWILNPKEFRDANAKVHKFANHYVKRVLNMSQEELEKEQGYTFLYELAKQTKDPKVLRDQLLNILVAGRDTTAGLLSFLFFELARNPEIFAKLKEEIYTRFGSGEDSRIEEITFESLKKCEYLKVVIQEALRLYPSVPQNFRIATKDTTLPTGGGPDGKSPILVRKGQNVTYPIFGTHRTEAFYGKDALEFKPERWFEARTRKLGWAYLPFNGGPRICLGQQFALTEASYVTVRIIQEFGNLWMDPETPYPPKKLTHLTMSLYNGCNIKLY
ncbi:ALK2 [[Candida] subhashii]|uniref:ALK2 n=1 Tax=[Candida] subhashii TaxID=561895 RepID=A0A8J5UGT8_9ASCO|nr:ALK2 [[Candida] subhashii]KAG7660467.1 ALK2 [[Candida] subhashii]